jgi:hypothetical protein
MFAGTRDKRRTESHRFGCPQIRFVCGNHHDLFDVLARSNRSQQRHQCTKGHPQFRT